MAVDIIIDPAPAGLPPIDITGEPAVVMRAQIDQKHANWIRYRKQWADCQLMYAGGEEIKRAAVNFLDMRPHESNDVYTVRINQFSYENNIGTGLGNHEATMFNEDPVIDIRTVAADGTSSEANLSPEQKGFWNMRFLKNCDRQGTAFVDLLRQVFTHLLLYKIAYVSIDLPSADVKQPPATLKEQQDKCLLDHYLTVINPLSVINWGTDEAGNLDWVVVYSIQEKAEFLGKPYGVERWYYYNKQQYRVYQAITKEETVSVSELTGSSVTDLQIAAGDKTPINLVRAGYHALAFENRVPVISREIQDGWWMANRAYLPARKHINLSSALDWSLFMAGMALPVVMSDDEMPTLTAGQSQFIKLGSADKFAYMEPSGRAWEGLSKRVETLKEEIWRSMYLVSQARNTSATAAAASAVSKQQDMQPSQVVLNGLGDELREAAEEILGTVAKARAVLPGCEADGELVFNVQGFSFEEKTTSDDLIVIQNAREMGVQSDTFDKDCQKEVVRRVFLDMSDERRTIIFDEIDAAPAASEIQAQQDAQQQQQLEASMRLAMSKDDPGDEQA